MWLIEPPTLLDDRTIGSPDCHLYFQCLRLTGHHQAKAARQKIARNNNGIAEVRQKRAKSEFSKVIANDQFIEKRNKVINLAPQFINMSDKKRIETLIQVLEISEDEARDILESAKKKPSLH